MPFFQNPFQDSFEGYWVLADRQASLTFRCPPNTGRGNENVQAHVAGPYNLSGNDANGNSLAVISLAFSLSSQDFKGWTSADISITGSSSSAITPEEIVSSINNSAFKDWFSASLQRFTKNRSTT
jgi:hypothetical protein